MGYVCPVCNGLSALHTMCPNCHHPLDDYGRADDLWGPYSPYREIDDLKMSNGFEDEKNHQCVHLTNCPVCGKDFFIHIDEQFQG